MTREMGLDLSSTAPIPEAAPARSPDPIESWPIDVRIALVMNGGVSLAVWIGGVAAEIYRAQQNDGLYKVLLEELRSKITIDVISGASAGGLNGVFLSAALSRNLTVGEFDQLRDVWLTAGAMKDLLRSPKEKNPPSLMDGDGYFEVQIENVLRGWLLGRSCQFTADDRLDLMMTATTLSPTVVARSDDLGQMINEPLHRGQFHFVGDDFREVAARELAAALALAARTSASFPGAFEASYVAIGPPSTTSPSVDMQGYASFDRSSWAIDGGVLMNKPVAPALEALRSRTSERHGRRLMLYVNPDPGIGAVETTADRTNPPTMLTVISDALLTLPGVQSIAADLNEIRDQNARLGLQRDTRFDLLKRLGDERLLALATTMYPLWVRKRAYDTVQRRLAANFHTMGGDLTTTVIGLPNGASTGVPRAVSYTWRHLANKLLIRLGANPDSPSSDNAASDRWTDAEFPDLSEFGPDGHLRRFGYEPLEYIASVILDLLRRAIDLLPVTAFGAAPDAAVPDPVRVLRVRLVRFRRDVQKIRVTTLMLREVDEQYWAAGLAAGPQRPAPTEEAASRPPDGGYQPDEFEHATDFARRLYDQWPSPPLEVRGRIVSSSYTARQLHRARLRWARFIAGATVGYGEELAIDPDAVIVNPDHSPAIENVDGWLVDQRPMDIAQLRDNVIAQERGLARELARILNEADPAIRAALSHTTTDDVDREKVHTSLEKLVRKLPPIDEAGIVTSETTPGVVLSDDEPDPAETLQKLFALYVVHSMTETIDETEVRLEFVQLSANADCPLDASRVSPADKVAGLQLAHFGAFYKESWRANDWMWGRLDCASNLVAALIEPARIRRQFTLRQAYEAIHRIATGVGINPLLSDDDKGELEARWERAQADVVAELTALFGPQNPGGSSALTVSHRTIVAAFQLMICRTELDSVATSVSSSKEQGAGNSPAAQRFVDEVNRLSNRCQDKKRESRKEEVLVSSTTIPLSAVRGLLTRCGVGRERLADEIGTDALTETATKAAAVIASAAAGTQSGLKVARHLFTTIRNLVYFVYVLARNATTRSKSSFALTQLLLAFGGGVVAVRIATGKASTPVLLVAIVILAVWAVLTTLTVGMGMTLVPLLLVVVAVSWSAMTKADAVQAFGGRVDKNGNQVPHRPEWKLEVVHSVPIAVVLVGLASVLYYVRANKRAKRHLTDPQVLKRIDTMYSKVKIADVAFDKATTARAAAVKNGATPQVIAAAVTTVDEMQKALESTFTVLVDSIRTVRRPLRRARSGAWISLVLAILGGGLVWLALRYALDTHRHDRLISYTGFLNTHRLPLLLGGLPFVYILLSMLAEVTRPDGSLGRAVGVGPWLHKRRERRINGRPRRAVKWFKNNLQEQLTIAKSDASDSTITYDANFKRWLKLLPKHET